MSRSNEYLPFSKHWVLLSAGIFVVAHILIGGWVVSLVGGSGTIHSKFLLEAVLNLSSYFIGGTIVGLVSPGVRIHEPAVGAAICVALMFAVSAFTPLSFVSFSLTKLAIGGVMAFVLALSGAKLGERLMGNRLPQA